ncbi:MAG: cell division protein SepF [Clostridia bacterium]
MAGIMDRLQKLWNPDDDEYYDEEQEFEGEDIESYSSSSEQSAPTRRRSTQSSSYNSNSSNSDYNRSREGRVVNVSAKKQLEVVVYKPKGFTQDINEIARTLMSKNAVVLNVEKTDISEARRILDFLSGVAFAQDGKITKVATGTYMITPFTVGMTGEEILDEYESGGMLF